MKNLGSLRSRTSSCLMLYVLLIGWLGCIMSCNQGLNSRLGTLRCGVKDPNKQLSTQTGNEDTDELKEKKWMEDMWNNHFYMVNTWNVLGGYNNAIHNLDIDRESMQFGNQCALGKGMTLAFYNTLEDPTLLNQLNIFKSKSKEIGGNAKIAGLTFRVKDFLETYTRFCDTIKHEKNLTNMCQLTRAVVLSCDRETIVDGYQSVNKPMGSVLVITTTQEGENYRIVTPQPKKIWLALKKNGSGLVTKVTTKKVSKKVNQKMLATTIVVPLKSFSNRKSITISTSGSKFKKSPFPTLGNKNPNLIKSSYVSPRWESESRNGWRCAGPSQTSINNNFGTLSFSTNKNYREPILNNQATDYTIDPKEKIQVIQFVTIPLPNDRERWDWSGILLAGNEFLNQKS